MSETRGKRRFGKKRVPRCECTHRFTCGACLGNDLRERPPEAEREWPNIIIWEIN